MATNYKLTWVGTRWRKMYKGHWFSYPGSEGKVATYPAAWKEFEQWKQSIDNELARREANTPEKELESHVMKWFAGEVSKVQSNMLANKPDSQELRLIFSLLEQMKQQGPIDRGTGHAPIEIPQTLAMIAPSAQPLKKPTGIPPWEIGNVATSTPVTTMGQAIVAYNDSRLAKVKANKLDAARFYNESQNLLKFQEFVGEKLRLEEVAPRMLEAYRQKVSGGNISDSTKNERLRVVKSIFNWLYSMEYIDSEPRILRKGYSVEVTAGKIDLPSIRDIQEMLAVSTPRVKLFALLALNCGMTQVDISDLKPSEYDAKKKTICRKRSKTKGEKNVPVVTYQLWPEVVELLSEFATQSKNAEHLLTNEDGNPLRSVTIKPDGKLDKRDAIDSAWDRVRRKTKKDNSSFKYLRKLSASTLASHESYGRYAQYFLGHAPESVADRHYVVPSDERFADALNWLRTKILGK